MRLIVVSSPVNIVDEAGIINRLFESGLTSFHLRKPDKSLTEVQKLLDGIDPEYYKGISLHQFHEIASENEIERLHFPENLRRETAVDKLNLLIEAGYKLSTSIHSLADLDRLISFEYAFFSPVFDSLSKPGYRRVVASDSKHTRRQKIDLIALGGVKAENIKHCMTMNFDGAAVLGSIWNDPLNAVNSFRSIMKVIHNEKNK